MIFGVDLGVRRIAAACPEKLWIADHHLPPRVPLERCGALLGAWLALMLPKGSEIWVERPLVFLNVRTAIAQAIVLGGVVARFSSTSHLFENTEWKKEIVGRGNASKDQIGAWLSEHHPELADLCRVGGELDEDRVDATCIGLHGARMGSRGGVPRS